jgi:hypothetical protein
MIGVQVPIGTYDFDNELVEVVQPEGEKAIGRGEREGGVRALRREQG